MYAIELQNILHILLLLYKSYLIMLYILGVYNFIVIEITISCKLQTLQLTNLICTFSWLILILHGAFFLIIIFVD